MLEDFKAKKQVVTAASNYQHGVAYEHGPLNKSEETKLFEKIVVDIIHDMKLKLVDEQNFEKRAELYEKESSLYVKHHGQEINLNKLITKVNLNHIKIPQPALDEYEILYDTAKIIDNEMDGVVDKRDFEDKINKIDDVKQRVNLQKLSYAERSAIRSYTGDDIYTAINGFLRGTAVPKRPDRIIIDLAVASQGLNKLPTTELPTVVRRQGTSQLNKMKELAETGEVQNTAAFISASYQPQTRFGTKLEIIYDKVRGVNVKPLSEFEEEDEYLIPPSTQIKYTGYKEINGLHVFTAEGVNVLLDKKYDITKEDKARDEIDELINRKSEKMEKENTKLTKKDAKEFIEEVLSILDENDLVSKEEKDLYLDTNNKERKSFLDKDVEKATKTPYLSLVKDMLCKTFARVCKTLGLKALSQKLKNQVSDKGLEKLRNNLEIKRIGRVMQSKVIKNQQNRAYNSSKVNIKAQQASKQRI